MRTLKAFLLAPFWPLVLMYVWTIAHFEMPYSVMTLINPAVWLFALVIGFPAFYVAELALALPAHYLLKRNECTRQTHYAIAGAAVGAAACWIWSAVVRAGPLPLHRDVPGLILIGIPAGAIGGVAFWRIAIGGGNPQWPAAKNITIIAAPLLLLYLGIFMVAGYRYGWREWASLPLADPGGFGMFIAIAVLVTLALAIDRWRCRGSVVKVTSRAGDSQLGA